MYYVFEAVRNINVNTLGNLRIRNVCRLCDYKCKTVSSAEIEYMKNNGHTIFMNSGNIFCDDAWMVFVINVNSNSTRKEFITVRHMVLSEYRSKALEKLDLV